MFLEIVAIVVVVLAVLTVIGRVFQMKNEFTISRSMVVKAAAKDCFEVVNDFHHWEKWSPWAKLDPTMKTAYEGEKSGEGAIYSWEGTGKVGAGRMTITKTEAPQRLLIHLEFFKPMKNVCVTEFTFRPEGEGTQVTWTMVGQLNLVSKLFHAVINMDKMVGGDFARGLAALKALVESGK